METVARPAAASIELKMERLRGILRECRSVCIGYSGGVDSVFLACVAVDELGADNVLAVTGRSPAYPQVQRDVAVHCAREFGIPHIEVDTDEMADPNYAANPVNRCYYCKSELWPKLTAVARERGLDVVLDGSNADDRGDYRPGFAAARENAVRSPLLEAGLTKKEVRTLSMERGLPTWDQPASPCLSSRLPYGVAVTPARLRQVERAEASLRELGYREFRVRHHDDCLRLEFAPAELAAARADSDRIHRHLWQTGVPRILIDLEGYRRGALNESLVQLAGVQRTEPVNREVPACDRAGFHGDIAVLHDVPGHSLADVAARLRAAGFRYVAMDTTAPSETPIS